MTKKEISTSENVLSPTSALQITEEEEETEVLIDRPDTTNTRYTIEIDPDKMKVLKNTPYSFQRGQSLEVVENFKYLGPIISNEGSKPEILSSISQATAALYRLKIIRRDKNISLAYKS